jgi:hypothetical protein
MSELMIKVLAEPQSLEHYPDVLLSHYHEIGISAVVAALNVIAEVSRSENAQVIQEVHVSTLGFLDSDEFAA